MSYSSDGVGRAPILYLSRGAESITSITSITSSHATLCSHNAVQSRASHGPHALFHNTTDSRNTETRKQTAANSCHTLPSYRLALAFPASCHNRRKGSASRAYPYREKSPYRSTFSISHSTLAAFITQYKPSNLGKNVARFTAKR